MSNSAFKIFSNLSKSSRRTLLTCTRTLSMTRNGGTNNLLLNTSAPLSSKSDNGIRTYATYREYENRQIWQCPRQRRTKWDYDDCDDYMKPKDWDLLEARAQTEGTCRQRIPFRDPPNIACQQMILPHCPLIKRVDWCDKAVIQPHCVKRESPYKAYSELKMPDVSYRIKPRHQCDYCPEVDFYLPYANKKQPHSDCTAWNRDLDHEKRHKWTPYSSHCYRKRKYLSCFWPYLTH